MESKKRESLEAAGWKLGSAGTFLGLSEQERRYVEIKLALSKKVREVRQGRNLTQAQAAKLAGSSQSRLAKMESGDPAVSVDLLVKTLIALGMSNRHLARTIGDSAPAAA